MSTFKPYGTVRKIMDQSITRRDQRREAILQIAGEVFSDEGYAAASMSTIAARVGGSKATLYNYFPSKEALFEAHIRDMCERFGDTVANLSQDRPVEEVLTELGERFVRHVISEPSVRNFQILVGESRRAPELARLFYQVGPAVGIERIQTYLEGAKARGAINPPDCVLAAEQFLALCRGGRHLRLVLNLEGEPAPEAIRSEVASAVAMFMAAYGVKAG
jgi:AcrR family transcriptional regulator